MWELAFAHFQLGTRKTKAEFTYFGLIRLTKLKINGGP